MALNVRRALPAALTAVCLVMVAGACGSGGLGNKGAKYPSDTVELVVPFAAGGATDSFARLVASYAEKHADMSIQVVNKEGAGGITGTNEVASSKKDGYKLIATAASNTMLNFATEQNAPYTPDDLTYIARVSLSPLVLIVKEDSPYRDAEALLAAVAKDPKAFTIGTSSLSGPSTFGAGKLLEARGINPGDPRLVVLNSGATTVTAVAGGQVDFAAQLAPEVRQLIEGRKIRGLAVSDEQPIASLPGVPSAPDAGIPGFNDASVSGIAGPKELPEEVVTFWDELLAAAVEDEEFRKQLEDIGSVPAFMDEPEYAKWNNEQIDEAHRIADALGITQ